MQQKSGFLILLLSLIFLPLIFSDARKEAPLGGWSPIKDTKDPHVIKIAEFAVEEYNKQSNGSLKLVKVVKGETQVVAGTNYRLILQAKEGTFDNTYKAVVWEKLWLNFRNLTSFNLVKG
ncbi:hypothetical protein ERO13_A06G154100v2 [Gossypium hirsutum]|uniref:Cysteine proteinase inhibitor 1 n=5 Tax=Gossypium TaxID=3633 RepID=A0A1U8PR12_GOSHI|nr:cysteine proteinase inhibitor 1-like [Gossypium hirsutum]KAB2078509.1 hypothetical protein ES319_A06G167400v1 [Gossypium barbadense]TYH14064.1 hypothetical protein ES288_A06G189300v1 [Gossypium darwinii]TYI23702.1 hypothetical protein ES332_A06G183100v1 [Gossypium tomentosum]TYJ31020.1 hypothetical protein E1A91_A06G168200v1 [Gossypium mustelinum]KAG4196196.1 hypothetical protein ERO13_A06G154100v2 [Gossypium hirsutum]